METIDDTQLRALARKRIEFRIHFIVFCVTIGALWIIWLFTGRGYLWPVWPASIWGIGLVFHYLFDYRTSKFLSEDEEYRKLKNRQRGHIAC